MMFPILVESGRVPQPTNNKVFIEMFDKGSQIEKTIPCNLTFPRDWNKIQEKMGQEEQEWFFAVYANPWSFWKNSHGNEILVLKEADSRCEKCGKKLICHS